MRIIYLGYILFLSIPISINTRADNYAPFEGSQKNNYGEIKWKSSVAQSSPNWRYRQEIWNNDRERNCKVTWAPVGLESFIPPGESIFSESQIPSRPLERSGELRLRGGSASGEYVIRDTRAWMPEGGELALSSKTRLFVDLRADGNLSPVELTSYSALSNTTNGSRIINLEFSVRGIPNIQLSNNVLIRWSFPDIGNVEFTSFDSEGRSTGRIEVTGDVRPRLGTVTLSNKDGEVLGKTTAPALVPVEPCSGSAIATMNSPVADDGFKLPFRAKELEGTWIYSRTIWTNQYPASEEIGAIVIEHSASNNSVIMSRDRNISISPWDKALETTTINYRSNTITSTWIGGLGIDLNYSEGTCKNGSCTTTWKTVDPITGQPVVNTESITWISLNTFKKSTVATNADGSIIMRSLLTATRPPLAIDTDNP